MVDNFIENYIKHRNKTVKKGYEVVGIPLTLAFFITLLCIIVNGFLIIKYNTWMFLFIEIILLIILWKINKKVDALLKLSWPTYEMKLKEYAMCYLKEKEINNSIQIKELSYILKEKSKSKYKKYDLNPYIAIVVAIFTFSMTLLSNEHLNHIIIQIALISIIIFISINPMVNTFTNIFINRESEIINELASVLDELYFEISTIEFKAQW